MSITVAEHSMYVETAYKSICLGTILILMITLV